MVNYNMKWIKLGDYAEALIHCITFGFDEIIDAIFNA